MNEERHERDGGTSTNIHHWLATINHYNGGDDDPGGNEKADGIRVICNAKDRGFNPRLADEIAEAMIWRNGEM